MEQTEKLFLMYKLNQVFRPGTPIDQLSLFAGRHPQVKDIIRGISQRGRHVIIYGERGVGKTSLSRVLFDFLTQVGIDVIRSENINCHAGTDFSTLWHTVFREMSFSLAVPNIGFRRGGTTDEMRSMEELLPEKVNPDDVRYILSTLAKQAIIILDEVDRIDNPETTSLLADTIKNLSDHNIPATLILIGVADSVAELIHEHRSTERSLVQVHMPRMSHEELDQIIEKGSAQCGMTFDAIANKYIVELSAGLPHYTHLISLYAGECAIEDNRTNVTLSDVHSAIQMTTAKSSSIQIEYYEAVHSAKKNNLYASVLLAAAKADKDVLGYFMAGSVCKPLSQILKRQVTVAAFSGHLDEFCSPKRGNILQKQGSPRSYRFRFVNPLMQPFVIMQGIAKGLASEEVLISITTEATGTLF